jgi:hypothetical protein
MLEVRMMKTKSDLGNSLQFGGLRYECKETTEKGMIGDTDISAAYYCSWLVGIESLLGLFIAILTKRTHAGL